MQIRVHHTIGDLADDLRGIAVRAPKDMNRTVREGIKVGNRVARTYAKRSAGPHGKNYYKRISAEMTGLLEGEFGPHGDVDDNAVGAGWRNEGPNTDLARTADVIGPAFAKKVRELPDEWFW